MRPCASIVRVASCLLFGSLTLASCKSEPEQRSPPPPTSAVSKAEISNEFTLTAEVINVNRTDRVVTLRREDGLQLPVKVSDAVHNFDQIAPGDTLRVRYKAALTAERMPEGTSTAPVRGALAAARAEKGAQPAGGMGMSVTMRVKIESVDRAKSIVVFSLASGELVAHTAQTQQGRDLISGLKPGDVVELAYRELLALSIDEV